MTITTNTILLALCIFFAIAELFTLYVASRRDRAAIRAIEKIKRRACTAKQDVRMMRMIHDCERDCLTDLKFKHDAQTTLIECLWAENVKLRKRLDLHDKVHTRAAKTAAAKGGDVE